MSDENPYKVGDWVTMVHSNGAGEGIIWRVVKIVGAKRNSILKIQPFFTPTGDSVLNSKAVNFRAVRPFTLIDMCALRQRVDQIIQARIENESTRDDGNQ